MGHTGIDRSSAPSCESLEPRTLLAATDLTVRVYGDADHDGVRDAGEVGVRAITVQVEYRDAQARTITSSRTTDSDGAARFTVNPDSGFPYVSAVMTDPARKHLPQPTSGSLFNIDRGVDTLDLWVRRVGYMTGLVKYRFTSADGTQQLAPLMNARVFVDYDRDGVRDTGEPRSVTDETGTYLVPARYGRHPVRVERRAGWRAAAGKIDAVMVSHIPRQGGATRVPSLHTQMFRPVVLDVLAVSAGGSSEIRSAFDGANHVFANSDAGVFLRLVDAQSAALTGSFQTMLRRLSNGRDGVADHIPVRRNAAGADLVVAFAHNPATASSAAVIGLAQVFDDRTKSSELAYAIVAPRAGVDDAGETLAHEVGHTLGAGHNPEADDDDQSGGGTSGAPAYAHGYRTTVGAYGDVMSYDVDEVVPAFSGPSVYWHGSPFGNKETADNVRRIRETAPVVSAYRRVPKPPRVKALIVSDRSLPLFPPGWQREWHGPFAEVPITV
jgi:hypothetical protein